LDAVLMIVIFLSSKAARTFDHIRRAGVPTLEIVQLTMFPYLGVFRTRTRTQAQPVLVLDRSAVSSSTSTSTISLSTSTRNRDFLSWTLY